MSAVEIPDCYRITAKLGAGGMGEFFVAEDTRLERKAAIKTLPTEMAGDLSRCQRFLQEARGASALNHRHVCVVYDVGETTNGQTRGMAIRLAERSLSGHLDPVLDSHIES